MNLKNKYKGLSVQARASLWYAVCNFFQKGIAFLVVPIYLRLISTAEFGRYNVFHSWANILIIFASLNLYCGVFTKAIVDMSDSKERDDYTSSMLALGTFAAVIMFGIYLIFRPWANQLIGLDTKYMILLFLYFIFYPAFSFWSARQRVEFRYIAMVIVTSVVSVLTPVTSLLLLKFTDLRERALILGYLLVQIVVGLFFYIFQLVKGSCLFSKKYWTFALKFNIPLIPHYVSLIVLAQSDRIMIEKMVSESDAGIYGFACTISSVITVLVSAINGSRVPWTYENLKNKKYDAMGSLSNVLTAMMGGITIMICLLTPEFVRILGTEEYLPALYVMPVVTLGVFYTFVYDLYASVEFYYGATKYVMYASTIGAVLNIILNAIFIPIFGFVAAGYTTLFCYFIFMLMHYLFSRKVLKANTSVNKVYENKTIFVITAITSAICLGCMATFSLTIVRIALILALMILAYVKRKTLINLYQSIRK